MDRDYRVGPSASTFISPDRASKTLWSIQAVIFQSWARQSHPRGGHINSLQSRLIELRVFLGQTKMQLSTFDYLSILLLGVRSLPSIPLSVGKSIRIMSWYFCLCFSYLIDERRVYTLILLPWWGASLFVSARWLARPLGETLILMICMPSWRLLSSARILGSHSLK